jgi:hypothetical protein
MIHTWAVTQRIGNYYEKWGVDQVNSQEVILMFSYKIVKTNKNEISVKTRE